MKGINKKQRINDSKFIEYVKTKLDYCWSNHDYFELKKILDMIPTRMNIKLNRYKERWSKHPHYSLDLLHAVLKSAQSNANSKISSKDLAKIDHDFELLPDDIKEKFYRTFGK